MSSKKRFLLINGAQGKDWHKVLKTSLAPLGELKMIEQLEADELIGRSRYDLVFIDATAVAEAVELVERIHQLKPQLTVVVAAASPRWLQARAVFRAGAADYIRKSYDEDELLAVTKAILEL